MTSNCDCESGTRETRLTCFITHYNKFALKRGKSLLNIDDYNDLRDINITSEIGSTLLATCELLILQAFYTKYTKNHSRFVRECLVPDFGNDVGSFKYL